MSKLVKYGPVICFGMLGGVLGACRFQFWNSWQFWAIDVTAFLCMLSAYFHGKVSSMKQSGFWIYPGERRPVVVKALTEKEAEDKVRKSPEYDGFGGKVYPVETFAELCDLGQAP